MMSTNSFSDRRVGALITGVRATPTASTTLMTANSARREMTNPTAPTVMSS